MFKLFKDIINLEVVHDPEEVAGPGHNKGVAVIDGEVGLEVGVLHALQLEPINRDQRSLLDSVDQSEISIVLCQPIRDQYSLVSTNQISVFT